MSLAKFEKDMAIIQQMDDEPNDVGGLSADELKAKFDEGGEALKAYLNDTLLPALEQLGIDFIVQAPDGSIKYLRVNEGGYLQYSSDGKEWETVFGSGGSGGIGKSIEFSVAVNDWKEDSAKTNGYGFYYDLADTYITKKVMPSVVIAENSLETAAHAGVCATANSYAGYVRLKSVVRPETAIDGVCHLFGSGASGSGTAITDLPVATASTLGAIMVGAGLTINEDGVLSVSYASTEETDKMIDSVFDS